MEAPTNTSTVHMQANGNCSFRAIAHHINYTVPVFDYHATRRDLAHYVDEYQQA